LPRRSSRSRLPKSQPLKNGLVTPTRRSFERLASVRQHCFGFGNVFCIQDSLNILNAYLNDGERAPSVLDEGSDLETKHTSFVARNRLLA
jgi:hypothetical protein